MEMNKYRVKLVYSLDIWANNGMEAEEAFKTIVRQSPTFFNSIEVKQVDKN
jgi:hypothetical protein